MFTGLNTFDFAKTKKKVHNTRNMTTILFIIFLYLVYQYINDDVTDCILYLYMIFIFFQIQPKIVRSRNTKYIYLISPSLLHNIVTKAIAGLVITIRCYWICFVYIPNPTVFGWNLKNSLTILLEVVIVSLMLSISASNYSVKVKYKTNKYSWTFETGRMATFGALLVFYFLILPIYFYEDPIALIFYICFAALVFMTLVKHYIKNWKSLRFYFFLLFEVVFIAIAFGIKLEILESKANSYLMTMLIVSFYKLFIIVKEINRIYQRFPQPNLNIRISNQMEKYLQQKHSNWTDGTSLEMIKTQEAYIKVQRMLLNKQISIESKGTISKIISSLVIDNIEKCLRHKRVLIFIFEVIVNLIIIIKLEIEYNLFGLVYIMYLTTSFCFKRTALRLKFLVFMVYPIFVLLSLQIFFKRSSTDIAALLKSAESNFIIISNENVANYKICYLLLAVVFALVNLYLARKNKEDDPIDIDKLVMVGKYKQIVKDLTLEIGKYVFHIVNMLCIFFFLRNIFSELNLLNMLVLIIFLLLIFFDSKNIEGLFQLILIYHSVKFTLTFTNKVSV